MRALVLFTSLLLPCALIAQTPATPSSPQIQADLSQALLGEWTGVLEYRDYSEPPTSSKRVQLPTWLSITSGGTALKWSYIYDDGPTKVVTENNLVTFDPSTSSYSESDNGKPPERLKVTGYEALRNGLGPLVLSGSGTDNDKPAETRITVTIRRNLLTLIEEIRPANSSEAFVFRHSFVFTRAQAPKPPPAK